MVKKTIKKVKAEPKEEKAEKPQAAKEAAEAGKKGEAKAKAEPKKGKKGAEEKKAGDAKEKKPERPQASPEEVAKLTKEAVADILKGIAVPDCQSSGTAYIPDGWHTKYKPTLGAYKKFLMSQSDKFSIVELKGGNFIVVKAGEKPPAISQVSGGNWKKLVTKAWNAYTKTVPEAEQSNTHFLAAISKTVAAAKASPKVGPASSPKLTAASSPKLSPAASPKSGPADKGVKKGKILKKKKKA